MVEILEPFEHTFEGLLELTLLRLSLSYNKNLQSPDTTVLVLFLVVSTKNSLENHNTCNTLKHMIDRYIVITVTLVTIRSFGFQVLLVEANALHSVPAIPEN